MVLVRDTTRMKSPVEYQAVGRIRESDFAEGDVIEEGQVVVTLIPG